MTLREKFEQWFINDEDKHYEGMVEQVAIEHEKIADNYAIKFAEWLKDKPRSQFNRESLEQFKKEKGL